MLKLTISIPPTTKKNSSRILSNRKTRKPFIAPSEAFERYQNLCGFHLTQYSGIKIERPVNVKAIYYMPTKRKVDLINLHSALHDVLVKYAVLSDDNSSIIVSTDGSRVRYDKENPRTEIEITEVCDES